MQRVRRGRSLAVQLTLRIGILSLLTLASILISVVAGSVLTLVVAHREIREESIQAASQFDIFLNTIETDLRAVSDALPQVRDPNLTLRDVLTRHPEVFTIRWIDADGTIRAQRQRVGRANQTAIDSQPWLENVQAGNIFWGEVNSQEFGVPFMQVAMPIHENEAFAGTLIVELDLTALWNAVSSVQVGENGYAYLIDADGRLLAYRDLALVRTNTPLQDRIGETPQQLVEDSANFFSSTHPGLNDQQVISSGTPLATLGWVAVVEQPISEALSNFYDEFAALILMLVLTGMVILNSVWFTRRQMVAPLRYLRDSVDSLRLGNMNERVTLMEQREDEIGTLADAFNRMADNIQRRTQDLVKANALARESVRLKSEFIAVMSHELRTPLNAVLGFTGLMLEGMSGKVDDDARQMLTRIETNGKRLLALINDILDISKIESGRFDLVSIPFSPQQLTEQWREIMAFQLKETYREGKVTYSIEIDPNLPAQLQGDPDRITQIANNLLSNAFKFTEKGSVTLRSSWDGANWVIQIQDTGIGIPPHAMDLIFEEFRQVDGSSVRRYGGTGLGLTIVRNLCTMMQGQVKVESNLGQGSTFTILLPLTVAEPATVLVK